MNPYTKLDDPAITSLLFHPREEPRPAESDGRINIDIDLDESTTLGCRLYLADTTAPTIIYFHGNGETVSDYEEVASHYNSQRINLFAATYRGYGWSKGTPSASNMMEDCKSIFNKVVEVVARMEIADRFFVMGRSLGSASAIELCHAYPEKITGLIVESGFAETYRLLENLGLSSSLTGTGEESGFGNLEKIGEITMPTLILHGAMDTIIPVHQAEKLQAFSGARTKKFFVIPGADHNSVLFVGGANYFSTIKDFIDDVTGVSDWRARRKKYKKQESDDND